jgi:phospholipase B1
MVVEKIMGRKKMLQGPSESVPTNVHTVRPADIRVVAAMGDSLTVSSYMHIIKRLFN